jgi:hypothetical protein
MIPAHVEAAKSIKNAVDSDSRKALRDNHR